MNYRHFGGLLLLLGTIGCASVNLARSPDAVQSPESPQANTQANTSEVSNAPASPTPTLTESAESAESSPIAPAASTALNVQRDFAPTAPLPATGQVTVRGNIRDVEADRMIAECPADSAPYAFAESTNYLVQICSAEYDPWLPKYYMSRAKDGSGTLELTNSDPNTARQLIFSNGDYTYTLYRDSARSNQTNAYLEVRTPDGVTHAEALLYFYEQVDRPTP